MNKAVQFFFWLAQVGPRLNCKSPTAAPSPASRELNVCRLISVMYLLRYLSLVTYLSLGNLHTIYRTYFRDLWECVSTPPSRRQSYEYSY